MHCVVFKKNSDRIERYLTDAVLIEQQPGVVDIHGSNGKRTGVKLDLFDLVWTEDSANPLFDADGKITGWDKAVSEIAPAAADIRIDAVDTAAFRQAVIRGREIASFTYAQVESFVDTNVADPGTAKVLKLFGRVLLALVKIQWRILREVMR